MLIHIMRTFRSYRSDEPIVHVVSINISPPNGVMIETLAHHYHNPLFGSGTASINCLIT